MRDGSHCDCAHAEFITRRLSSRHGSTYHNCLPSLLRHTLRRHDCTILYGERTRCGLRREYVNIIGEMHHIRYLFFLLFVLISSVLLHEWMIYWSSTESFTKIFPRWSIIFPCADALIINRSFPLYNFESASLVSTWLYICNNRSIQYTRIDTHRSPRLARSQNIYLSESRSNSKG